LTALSLVLALVLSQPAHAETCVDYATQPKRLMDLEEDALKGALDNADKECLEQSYVAAEQNTTKDKISRVLMVNAYAYSTDYWAKLVRRHLDEIDRSDPDVAYLYAMYLYNSVDEPDLDEVIRWTEVALERKDAWSGEVHVIRVHGLLRLRSLVALASWKAADEARARGAENTEEAEALRHKTKTYAREWVDFDQSADRDPTEALAVCLSAAVQKQACGID